MPWRGDKENLIDRFDVRANLDHISESKPQPLQLSKDEMIEERRCNYERYKSGNSKRKSRERAGSVALVFGVEEESDVAVARKRFLFFCSSFRFQQSAVMLTFHPEAYF